MLRVVVLLKENEPPADSDPFQVRRCAGFLDAVEHVLNHWEILNFHITPEFQETAIAEFLHDLVAKLLPEPLDRKTLPEGYDVLRPPGLLSSEGFRFWYNRKPELVSDHVYLDELDSFVSKRQMELLRRAKQWSKLALLEPPPGQLLC